MPLRLGERDALHALLRARGAAASAPSACPFARLASSSSHTYSVSRSTVLYFEDLPHRRPDAVAIVHGAQGVDERERARAELEEGRADVDVLAREPQRAGDGVS